VVGALIFFALLPPLTRHVGGTRILWAEAVDRRIKFTSSVLRHIKAIKLSAYEPRILDIANSMRNDEMNAFVAWVKQVLKVSIMTNWLSHGLALMTVTAFTLVVLFTGGDVGGQGGVTTARIFTVISTIELISTPLLELGQKLGSLLTAWASLKRIEGFLMDGEKGDAEEGRGEVMLLDRPVRGRAAKGAGGADDNARGGEGARVVLQHATFGVEGKIDLLHDLNVELDEPGLWMITGRVGCVRFTSLCLFNTFNQIPPYSVYSHTDITGQIIPPPSAHW
jgi:ABC-type multidrug transport system fused ATPase/permease subunit